MFNKKHRDLYVLCMEMVNRFDIKTEDDILKMNSVAKDEFLKNVIEIVGYQE